jgi:hypothetical protein
VAVYLAHLFRIREIAGSKLGPQSDFRLVSRGSPQSLQTTFGIVVGLPKLGHGRFLPYSLITN